MTTGLLSDGSTSQGCDKPKDLQAESDDQVQMKHASLAMIGEISQHRV